MDTIVNVQDLSIHLRKHIILENITFSVFPGEFVAILGRNGCGKSTLLKALLGFIRPSKGTIKILGQSAGSHALRKAGAPIGYIPQNLFMDYRMPFFVEDIVAMGGLAGGSRQERKSAKERARIDEAMDDAGILSLAKRPVGHLSGGEQQKVQIARILYQNPKLLLLDEPASQLDISAQFELLELLQRIQQEKRMTMLLVMHDLQNLPGSCDRAIMLHEQGKYFDGPLTKLYTSEILRPVYHSYADTLICKN
jgi:ABC-type cobalamin/Fe3+-siderophores transport system ATPase subunit